MYIIIGVEYDSGYIIINRKNSSFGLWVKHNIVRFQLQTSRMPVLWCYVIVTLISSLLSNKTDKYESMYIRENINNVKTAKQVDAYDAE